MNLNNLQENSYYKDMVKKNVRAFVKKHKRLRFLGAIYAFFAFGLYSLWGHFYHNVKRYTCLLAILFFFISSSSFTYPEAISLNVSFVTDFVESEMDDTKYYTEDSFEADLPESEAELAKLEPVDKEKILSEDETVSEDQELKEGFLLAGDIDNLEDAEDTGYEIDDTQKAVFDKNDWKLILINKQHPIPDNYEFTLGEIDSTMKCDERVLPSLKALLKGAAADGINLAICSPYRDSARQENLFARKINNYIQEGLSYMEAYNATSQAVTVPGASEHQIGLAFDIVCGSYYNLDEGFGDTEAGKWLADNSYKYGFVVRYLKGKENITGIEYEPWHFRYVGVDAATVMYNENLCLEEFWDNYLYD